MPPRIVLSSLRGRIRRVFARLDEEGQGLVEYGLILGLIAVVAIAALNSTGNSVNNLIQKVASSLNTVGESSGGGAPPA